MTAPKTYGIGIIGLGIMGRRMAEALKQHPRFRVVGAYDPAPAAGSDLGRVTTAAELAEHPAVDCLYVASPPAHHAAGVDLAIRCRKPILCEKPLSSTVAEAESLRDRIAAAQLPSAVNFYLAAAEPATRMRQLIAGGAVGEIKQARLTLRFKAWPRPWQSGAGGWLSSAGEGGYTREVGSHFLFQAGRILGPGRCAETFTQRGPNGTETVLRARIDYRDVSLEIDGAIVDGPDEYNRFEITGTKGQVALVDWDELDFGGSITGLPAVPGALDQLAAMLDGEPHELASFAEGAAVTRLTEALLA